MANGAVARRVMMRGGGGGGRGSGGRDGGNYLQWDRHSVQRNYAGSYTTNGNTLALGQSQIGSGL